MVSGLISVILAMLVSFGQSGVKKPTAAPNASKVMLYADADADYFGYMNWQSFVPGLWEEFQKVHQQPLFREVPELGKGLGMMQSALRGQLAELKKNIGVDLIKDIRWIVVSFTASEGEPQAVLVIQGNFPKDLLDKLSTLSGNPLKDVNGTRVFQMKADGPVVGMAADNTLVIGTESWVVPRVSAQWKKQQVSKASPGYWIASALKKKPALVFGSSPGSVARKQIRGSSFSRKLAFLRDALTAHKAMAVSVRHNGFDLMWEALTDHGFKTASLGIEGALELLRASHPAIRGLMKFGMSALRSYAVRNAKYAKVLEYEKLLLEYVDQWTGTGRFKAKFKADKRSKTVTLSANDKSIMQIVPLSAVIPAVGIYALAMEMDSAPEPPSEAPADIEVPNVPESSGTKSEGSDTVQD